MMPLYFWFLVCLSSIICKFLAEKYYFELVLEKLLVYQEGCCVVFKNKGKTQVAL